MTIKIKEQNFVLHHFGVVFWEEKKMILIADVHFGKIGHFRKHGIAIPNKAFLENFNKLNEILNFFEPEKIVFLGDLFHSNINIEWDFFQNWIQTLSQEVILIQGNHDIIDHQKFEDLGIKIYNELSEDGFVFTHYPLENPVLFNFCGHIHPSVQLKGFGKQFLKLPCFFQKPNQMILPAFGEFTGTYTLFPTEKDKVFAITKEKVVEVNL